MATCPQCAQPMVASAQAEVPRIDWELTLPSGFLKLGADRSLQSTRGPLTAGEARAWVSRELGPAPWWKPQRPMRSLFQAAVLTSVLGPMTAFLLAVIALSIFVGPALDEWSKAAQATMQSLNL